MKINLKCAEASWRTVSKIFLIMKLTIIILIIGLAQVSAKSYGQLITLHEKNVSVEKVLLLIENQSGYHFIYDDNLDILKTKTLKPKNKPLAMYLINASMVYRLATKYSKKQLL